MYFLLTERDTCNRRRGGWDVSVFNIKYNYVEIAGSRRCLTNINKKF